ncbi:hypothetical protein ACOT81_16945 [Streptomyces sp. WI04-05B]|uniref:hypothetical protein n=1 Tax=Streptomyces TaxID=1883 RepID=UPI0029A9C4AA|nr:MULTISPECIES: hypothetical protein [unclassified Streptomyces]MDX2543847.1 hypothetical protein [Streptomyces sp. WI04-05B]MDX2582063.1 hypothetical protein [Streptomyces sp. WI04-05A]MDX3752475.1 hypothetical protein [Streptomyces sp. AK08-02]
MKFWALRHCTGSGSTIALRSNESGTDKLWLAGCKRLHHRDERKPERFLALVGVAAILVGHRRLQPGTRSYRSTR